LIYLADSALLVVVINDDISFINICDFEPNFTEEKYDRVKITFFV